MYSNRRSATRIDVQIPASYKIVRGASGDVLVDGEAFISNISEDGLCLRIEVTHAKAIADLLKNKYQLQVEFSLPSAQKLVKPLSKIVWTENLNPSLSEQQFSMGLYFVEFNEKERKELVAFINMEYIKMKRSI